MSSRPSVEAVCRTLEHSFTKEPVEAIELVEGLGVAGDAHAGKTVKHRSRVRRDPSTPNLRQAHLIPVELHQELGERGFDLWPGAIGENITTRGVELLALPTGARLTLGTEAIIELTGLRNPCVQLDRFAPGLMAAVLDRAPDGSLVRRCGVMAVVVHGGPVRAGDPIVVRLPSAPAGALEPV